MNLKSFERKRIMNMAKSDYCYICSNCKSYVFPRYIDYSSYYYYPYKSGLYWCPKCLKGNAGIFWREI